MLGKISEMILYIIKCSIQVIMDFTAEECISCITHSLVYFLTHSLCLMVIFVLENVYENDPLM